MSETRQPELSDKLLQGQSLGYILLKCQEVLQNADGQLTTYELQLALANCSGNAKTYTVAYYAQLFSDPSFINVLRNNSRIHFDVRSRKWSFVSPYAAFTKYEKLLDAINQLPDGLEVTQELLEYNPHITAWIHRLLEEKRVRAIRTGKPGKCKSFSPESGFQCDIYDARANKCENCATLRNLTLYSRARPEAENFAAEASDATFHLDDDLREIWASVTLPAMEKILEAMKVQDKMKQLESKKRVRRRSAAADGSRNGAMHSGRVGKIANAHIYSAEEYRAELNNGSGP